MDELAVSDVSEMLVNFAGMGPAILSPGTENQSGLLAGDAKDYKAMSSRGSRISNPRRDGFLRSDTSLMDSFDVESSEIVLGSNSLLFGSGDAGGVVNITSKRGRLNQRFAKFVTTWDSEGSLRLTTDLNYGNKYWGVRINALEGNDRYFRPVLRNRQEGLQVAPIARPLPWLTLFGEYRHLDRNNINSGNPKAETVRAPLNLILSNGERLDNQPVRKITGLGGPALLDNYLNLTNQDSISGAYKRHYYIVEGQSVGFEARASNDLYFQFRYGQDLRNNFSVAPGDTVLYHPDAPGNLYVDANGRRQWAMNTSPTMTSTQQGARGYKLSGVYHKNAGPLGRSLAQAHRLPAVRLERRLSPGASMRRMRRAKSSRTPRSSTMPSPAGFSCRMRG
jgi:outer membrane receptor protein involved in Fe transport